MDEPVESARIAGCAKCGIWISRKLLRDDNENVPQPGFIVSNYWSTRVALAGPSPGVGPARFASRDAAYTAALRALRKTPDEAMTSWVNNVLLDFSPDRPVHGSYFPLRECGPLIDQ